MDQQRHTNQNWKKQHTEKISTIAAATQHHHLAIVTKVAKAKTIFLLTFFI